MLSVTTLVLWFAVGAQDRERVLDLTRPPEPSFASIAPYQSCRAGGRGAEQSGGTPPFALAVEGFDDKIVYSMGNPIVVDVRLTNTSQRSLPVPTVFLDQFHEPFEGDEAIQFGLTISMKDSNGQEHELSGTALRGSTKIFDTTQLLGPGESIRIHFPGYIPIMDGPGAPPASEGPLFASLVVTDGECRWWKVVRSEPVGKVRFSGRYH